MFFVHFRFRNDFDTFNFRNVYDWHSKSDGNKIATWSSRSTSNPSIFTSHSQSALDLQTYSKIYLSNIKISPSFEGVVIIQGR